MDSQLTPHDIAAIPSFPRPLWHYIVLLTLVFAFLYWLNKLLNDRKKRVSSSIGLLGQIKALPLSKEAIALLLKYAQKTGGMDPALKEFEQQSVPLLYGETFDVVQGERLRASLIAFIESRGAQ